MAAKSSTLRSAGLEDPTLISSTYWSRACSQVTPSDEPVGTAGATAPDELLIAPTGTADAGSDVPAMWALAPPQPIVERQIRPSDQQTRTSHHPPPPGE